MFYFYLNTNSPTVAPLYHVFLEETHVFRIICAQRPLSGVCHQFGPCNKKKNEFENFVFLQGRHGKGVQCSMLHVNANV